MQRALDLDLVRTFLAIADSLSFTRAAARVGRQQSTISLQMRRLEAVLEQRLIERSPRHVRLTPAGEAFISEARALLALNDHILARLGEPALSGLVRLATPEDFATRHLPVVLARFAKAYPSVALEVTCDLTLNILDRFRAGAFDLALIKREPALETGGIRVWREPLVWVRAKETYWPTPALLPLVVSPAPCVYRQRAINALKRAGHDWRIAYTCASLAGSLAAVKAGLGMTVLPKDMVPADLHIIDAGPLPDLRDTEIALLQSNPLSAPAERLMDHIIRSLG